MKKKSVNLNLIVYTKDLKKILIFDWLNCLELSGNSTIWNAWTQFIEIEMDANSFLRKNLTLVVWLLVTIFGNIIFCLENAWTRYK